MVFIFMTVFHQGIYMCGKRGEILETACLCLRMFTFKMLQSIFNSPCTNQENYSYNVHRLSVLCSFHYTAQSYKVKLGPHNTPSKNMLTHILSKQFQKIQHLPDAVKIRKRSKLVFCCFSFSAPFKILLLLTFQLQPCSSFEYKMSPMLIRPAAASRIASSFAQESNNE